MVLSPLPFPPDHGYQPYRVDGQFINCCSTVHNKDYKRMTKIKVKKLHFCIPPRNPQTKIGGVIFLKFLQIGPRFSPPPPSSIPSMLKSECFPFSFLLQSTYVGQSVLNGLRYLKMKSIHTKICLCTEISFKRNALRLGKTKKHMIVRVFPNRNMILKPQGLDLE